MILYHGSYTTVEQPLVSKCRDALDFGKGFYLTSYREQAASWAIRRATRMSSLPLVNVYDVLDIDALKVLRFEENDREWVEFVCACRRGASVFKEYDVIYGGVANEKSTRQ